MVADSHHLGRFLEDLRFDGGLVGVGQGAGVVDQIVGRARRSRPLDLPQRRIGRLALETGDAVPREHLHIGLEDRGRRVGELLLVREHVGQCKLVGLPGQMRIAALALIGQLGGVGPCDHLGDEGVHVLAELVVAGDPDLQRVDLGLVQEHPRVGRELRRRLDPLEGAGVRIGLGGGRLGLVGLFGLTGCDKGQGCNQSGQEDQLVCHL